MDFQDSSAEAEYRQRLRDFLEADGHRLVRSDGEFLFDPRDENLRARRETEAVLYDAGYVGVTWPHDYGGQGGTAIQQAIVNEELARAGVIGLVNHIGIGMCGPTILAHGSEDQKRRYLRRLLRADEIWCQLFSEPGGGSDVAALRTTARRGEDGTWVVNGQKVWTTMAHYADYGILLARTNPDVPKHRGLTMFLVDMRSPGVTARPIRQMTGVAEFNEVFFDNVVVPDSERLGEVDEGWRVALTTLMNERVAVGGGGGELGVREQVLLQHAAARIPQLSPEDQVLARQALGRVLVESYATRFSGYRRLTAIAQGRVPGPEASAGKLAATWTARAGADLGVRLLGPEAVFERTEAGDWLWATAQSSVVGLAFAGGTDEVLRNIIGERVLGLPAEPQSANPGGNRS